MKLRKVIIPVVALGVIAGAWLVVRSLQRMPGRIEDWTAKQLLAIADAHLGPKLTFDELHYQYPRTVSVTNVRLTQGTDDIIKADALQIDLARVPRPGEPIVLEAASFDSLVVRLIPQQEGGLVGFSNFIKEGQGSRTADGGSTMLSDVLAIETIVVQDGGLHYEPPGKSAMRLEPMTFDFTHRAASDGDTMAPADTTPGEGAAASGRRRHDEGWYAFDTTLGLSEVGQWKASARLNFNDWSLDIDSSELDLTLEPDQYKVLTPEMQDLLRKHQVRGDLVATLRGLIDFNDSKNTDLDFDVKLSDANMVLGSVAMPVELLDFSGSLAAGVVDIPKLVVRAPQVTSELALHLDPAADAVTLTKVSLTSGTDEFVSADTVRIAYAEKPGDVLPIIFESVSLDTLAVRLIPQSGGGLVGFSNFARNASRNGDGGGQDTGGGTTRLSDVLVIETISMTNAGLSYEPPGKTAMKLAPLTFDFTHETPASVTGDSTSSPGDAGWYSFDASLALDPVGRFQTDARLNLDDWSLDVTSAKLDMTLGADQSRSLLPEFRDFLEKREISGTLSATCQGLVPLKDALNSTLDFGVNLSDANVLLHGAHIPVALLDLTGSFDRGIVEIPKAQVQAFLGSAELSVHLDTGDDHTFDVKGHGEKLRLGEVLRRFELEGKGYEGDIAFEGEVGGSVPDLPASLTGQANVNVTNAHLSIVRVFCKEFHRSEEHTSRDRAEATMNFDANGFDLKKFNVVGRLIAVRGSGRVSYAGDLDLVVNAGPIERAEEGLGLIGDILGAVTDRLAAYSVDGPSSDPKITVRPLRIGH